MLLSELSGLVARSTGIIPDNRTEEAISTLVSEKVLQKQGGAFDYCCDEVVLVVMRRCRAMVTIAVNWETHERVRQAQRRFRGGG